MPKYWKKSRGKDVVKKTLGEIFEGVLVVDGWGAYLSLICEQQSCMAHLLRKIRKLHQRLDKLIKWENPNEILSDIIKKVIRQRPRILTFVKHEGVPCHNNFAEYLIRIGVLKRKVSFGSKSPEGAEAYAVLLSIYTTCKLRQLSFVDFLKASLKQHIKTGKPMLIKEFEGQEKNS